MSFDNLLLANRIKAGIDAATIATDTPRYSWRLKPSNLAEECRAKLYFDWRWTRQGKRADKGNRVRLRRRGSLAEANIVSDMRAAGWEIREYSQRLIWHGAQGHFDLKDWEKSLDYYEHDHSENETSVLSAKAEGVPLKQYRITDFGGHLSGYIDAKGRHPDHTNGQWIVLEFKTFNARRFAEWKKKTSRVSDPKYYGQIVMYLKYDGAPFGMIVGICKDNDEDHYEIVMPDEHRALELINVGHSTMYAPVVPARIASSETFHVCKTCDHADVCWRGQLPDRNCRSCVNVYPIEGGKFACQRYGVELDEKTIKQSCADWTPIRV